MRSSNVQWAREILARVHAPSGVAGIFDDCQIGKDKSTSLAELKILQSCNMAAIVNADCSLAHISRFLVKRPVQPQGFSPDWVIFTSALTETIP